MDHLRTFAQRKTFTKKTIKNKHLSNQILYQPKFSRKHIIKNRDVLSFKIIYQCFFCSQKSVKFGFEIGVQIQNQPMFESSEFLDIFLPQYFSEVIEKSNFSSCAENGSEKYLEILWKLMHFICKMFQSMGLNNNLHLFLTKQFGFLKLPLEWRLHSDESKVCEEKSKIMKYLESKLDKIALACAQLYIKIFHISIIIQEESSISSQEQSTYADEILLFFKNARLQYEISRFQTNICKDYDEYVLQIFNIVEKQKINPTMQSILTAVLSSQFSNVSDATTRRILDLLKQKQEKNDIKKYKQSQKYENSFDKVLLKINKKSYKSNENKIRLTPTKKNIISPRKMLRSPDQKIVKNVQKNQSQYFSPYKRIEYMSRLQKQKQICKQRTIYYGRKNIHMPKMNWLQNSALFKSNSTLPSFEKDLKSETTGDKSFRFDQEISMFDQNDNILVRSTPKAKKMALKVISQKLQF